MRRASVRAVRRGIAYPHEWAGTVLFVFAALCAVVLSAYIPSFTGWNLYDDAHWISEILTPVTLWPTWDLAHWSLSLNAALGWTSPWGYHLVNVGIHCLNGWLVFVLVRRLLLQDWARTHWPALMGMGLATSEQMVALSYDQESVIADASGPALFAAAVFLLHPIQTESVAYLTGRWELVSTCLILLTLVSPWWLATVTAVLAMTTKTSAIIVLPLILLVRRRGDDPILLVPILGAVVVAGLALYADRVGKVPYLFMSPYGPVEYAARQAVAFWRLLALVVVPWGQTVDHDWAHVPVWTVAAAIPALMGVGVEIARRRTEFPLCWLAAGWILICVAPRFVIRTPELMAEHHFYPVMVGVALAVGSAVRS